MLNKGTFSNISIRYSETKNKQLKNQNYKKIITNMYRSCTTFHGVSQLYCSSHMNIATLNFLEQCFAMSNHKRDNNDKVLKNS